MQKLNNLAHPFLIGIGLKESEGLAPMRFNLALVHAIRKIPVYTSDMVLLRPTKMIVCVLTAKVTFVKLGDEAKKLGRSTDKKVNVMVRTRKRMCQKDQIPQFVIKT